TNFAREVASNEGGGFSILELPPGIYKVTVTAEGFSKETAQFELGLGTTTKINFILRVSSTPNEVIEVTASDAFVPGEGKTESATNIDSGRIENLPINQRNFLDFTLTAARIVPDRIPKQGATATSGFSVNSQSSRYNNLTVDGLDNNETLCGGVRTTFSQDAVKEFQVVSDSCSAEAGRALGGVVNIVTKNGINEFHGSIFNYIRNDALSARDVFASFKPNFEQYQYGATVSGPIKKD